MTITFDTWCGQYGRKPDDPESSEDYQLYLQALALLKQIEQKKQPILSLSEVAQILDRD